MTGLAGRIAANRARSRSQLTWYEGVATGEFCRVRECRNEPEANGLCRPHRWVRAKELTR